MSDAPKKEWPEGFVDRIERPEQAAWAWLTSKFQDRITELMRERQKAEDQFTLAQAVDTFLQAMRAGDFERHVVAGTGPGEFRQEVTYIPGRQLDEALRDAERRRKQFESLRDMVRESSIGVVHYTYLSRVTLDIELEKYSEFHDLVFSEPC